MKKIILSLIFIFCLGFTFGCDFLNNNNNNNAQPVIDIEDTILNIAVGETHTFNVSIKILMESSDNKVASVDENSKTVTGISEGTATITIYALEDTTVSKQITVNVGENNGTGVNAIVKYIKDTVVTETDGDVTLPKSHPTLGGTIVWTTNSSKVDLENGFCELSDNDEVVTLTYNIDLNGEKASGNIELTLIGYNMLDAKVDFINQIKGSKISGDLNLETSFSTCGGTTVTWSSSDTNILSNDGKFTKPDDDSSVTITYTVTTKNPATVHTYSKTFSVSGKTILEKAEPVMEWIEDNIAPNGVLTETTELPTKLPEFNATLVYKDTEGYTFDIQKYLDNPIISGRFVLVVYIKLANEDSTVTYEKVCSVQSSSVTSIWDNVELFLNQIASNNYTTTVKPSHQLYKNGYLPFFTAGKMAVDEQLITKGTNARPGTIKSSTQYIVVHDTANTNSYADAQNQANYLKNNQDTDTSWHYTIDESVCIRSIPDKEVAWHAGDGGRTWGSTYFNETYQAWSITGGSVNGIGIESCVNSSGDYGMTERNLAKLVAQLLLENNLTIDRVKQHNDFSGKNCPALLRQMGFWNRFLYLVQLEIYGQTVLKDITFTYTSTSSNISDKGVISAKSGTVSYTVKAEYNGQSKTYTFNVTI